MVNEFAFLYCCIQNPEALKELPHVHKGVFTDQLTLLVCEKTIELMKKFETISVNMLRSHLPENLMDSFLNQVPENIDVSEYKSYLEIIQNEYSYTHLGRCISILEGGIVSKRDPLVIINQVSDITKEAIKSKSLGTTHTTRSLIEKVEYGFTGNDPIITLGLPSIDEIIGTCDLGNYVIIGGRPGMAKTATILQSAIQKSVYENQPTAIFTLEMSGESLMKRIISNVAGIALTSIRLRKLTDKQWENYQAAKERIANAPLHIIEDVYSIPAIEARIEFLKEQNPDLIFVYIDYIQLIASDNQELTKVSKEIKRIAKKFNIIIVICSQLSRLVEAREDKRPMKSDLRESGSLEQDADIILFPWYEAYYNKEQALLQKDKVKMELIVDKNRNGETGTRYCVYNKKCQRFVNSKE